MNTKHLETCAFIGSKGVQTLSSKTVTIVGLGGIGSTLSQILIRNGINLRVVDKARVDEKDVLRQTLYIIDDVSKFKAKQAKKRLEEINKEVKIKTFHEDLNEDNIFLLESDLIIDVSNNMETSLLIDQFTSSKKIPLLFANYAGEKGHIYYVHKKQPRIKKIQEKLALESIKQVGVFSPITTILAGMLASKVMKQLLGLDVDERVLSVDNLKGETKRTTISSNSPAKVNSKPVEKKKTTTTKKVSKKKSTTKKAKKKTSANKK